MTSAADAPRIRAFLEEYYGRTLQQSADLATNACCAVGAPPGFLREALRDVHPDVTARFYGCGFPIPRVLEGCTVLDLGCGTGRDVYLAAQLVGEHGFVHGVDMTAEQLDVARRTIPWHMDRFGFREPNVAFHRGLIEDLSFLGDASVDVVISNCVVNLSPAKDRVLAEVWRVLAPGGELYLSDVVCDRRLPADVVRDPVLHAECLGGAMYDADFTRLARTTGFMDPREMVRAPITIQSREVQGKVGGAQFDSVTYRLFKIEGLEPQEEDHGQVATYRGDAPGVGATFHLDGRHVFMAGRRERVSGNTALMLTNTRFAPHFAVTGDRSLHHGAFTADPAPSNGEGEERRGGGCC